MCIVFFVIMEAMKVLSSEIYAIILQKYAIQGLFLHSNHLFYAANLWLYQQFIT